MQTELIPPYSVPRVGVGVIVMKDGKIFMQKRMSPHSHGTWSFPGGWLEFGESLEDCARRETMEEFGFTIKNLRKGPYTNDIHVSEGKHVVTHIVIADYDTGEPRICEPEKCAEIRWVAWDEMPEPLFLPIIHLKESGYDPFVT